MPEANEKHPRQGQFIHFNRKEEGYSLAVLSERSGVPREKLETFEEQGVPPGPDALARIHEVLGIPRKADLETLKTLDEHFDALYQNILYRNYPEAQMHFQAMQRERKRHVKADRFIDFYLIMFVATFHLQRTRKATEPPYRAAKRLRPFMDVWRKGLFDVEEAIYLARTEREDTALEQLDACLATIEDPHHLANAHFAKGVILHNDFHRYPEAEMHIKKAQNLYERHANFHRGNRAKTILQIIHIHQNNHEEFARLHEEAVSFAAREGALELYYFNRLNMARRHLFEKEFEQALAVLAEFRLDVAWYYVFKLYALTRLGRSVLALSTLDECKRRQPRLYKPTERMFFDTLERLLLKGADAQLLERFADLCDTALSRGDFLMLFIATDVYTRLLEEKRMYKKAYIRLDEWLNVLKTIRNKRRRMI